LAHTQTISVAHPNSYYRVAVQDIEQKNLAGEYTPPEIFQKLLDNKPTIELAVECGERICKIVAVSLDIYGSKAPFLTGVVSKEGYFLAAQVLEVAPTVDEAIVQMKEWQFAISQKAMALYGN